MCQALDTIVCTKQKSLLALEMISFAGESVMGLQLICMDLMNSLQHGRRIEEGVTGTWDDRKGLPSKVYAKGI